MDEGFVKQYIFTKNKNTPLIENMKIFLQYQAYYIRVWNELKENNKRQTCQRNVLCETWSIPKELVLEKNYQVDKEEMSEKFVYDKLFYNQNFLEILMSNFLEEQEHVLFWLKNGDKGDKHFCIPYEVNGEKKLTYPDFLVETKEEIILIETKGILDGKETNEKWKAMKSYAERVAAIQNKKVRAILVKEKNGRLYVFTGRDVSDEYNLASKWEKLISLK